MKIKVAIKSMTNQNEIKFETYDLNDPILNLESLIIQLVEIQIIEYDAKNKENYTLKDCQISKLLEVGKVSFFSDEDTSNIDISKAEKRALDAYKDGLFSVFINEKQVLNLNDLITLVDDDIVVFIKHTQLTGQY